MCEMSPNHSKPIYSMYIDTKYIYIYIDIDIACTQPQPVGSDGEPEQPDADAGGAEGVVGFQGLGGFGEMHFAGIDLYYSIYRDSIPLSQISM